MNTKLQLMQFRRARALVAAGWTQNKSLRSDGSMCIEGALAFACGNDTTRSIHHSTASRELVRLAFKEVERRGWDMGWAAEATPTGVVLYYRQRPKRTLLQKLTGHPARYYRTVPLNVLWRWNDAIGTTQADVLSVLDAVIARLEGDNEPVWERIVRSATGLRHDHPVLVDESIAEPQVPA